MFFLKLSIAELSVVCWKLVYSDKSVSVNNVAKTAITKHVYQINRICVFLLLSVSRVRL